MKPYVAECVLLQLLSPGLFYNAAGGQHLLQRLQAVMCQQWVLEARARTAGQLHPAMSGVCAQLLPICATTASTSPVTWHLPRQESTRASLHMMGYYLAAKPATLAKTGTPGRCTLEQNPRVSNRFLLMVLVCAATTSAQACQQAAKVSRSVHHPHLHAAVGCRLLAKVFAKTQALQACQAAQPLHLLHGDLGCRLPKDLQLLQPRQGVQVGHDV